MPIVRTTPAERLMLWGMLGGYAALASAGFIATITLFGAFS